MTTDRIRFPQFSLRGRRSAVVNERVCFVLVGPAGLEPATPCLEVLNLNFDGLPRGAMKCSEVFEMVGFTGEHKTTWQQVSIHNTPSFVWTFDHRCGHSCGRGMI